MIKCKIVLLHIRIKPIVSYIYSISKKHAWNQTKMKSTLFWVKNDRTQLPTHRYLDFADHCMNLAFLLTQYFKKWGVLKIFHTVKHALRSRWTDQAQTVIALPQWFKGCTLTRNNRREWFFPLLNLVLKYLGLQNV